MERIAKVIALKDYHLYLEFADGVKGEIDLSRRLFGPMFEPLKDPEFFSQVGLDDFGAVCAYYADFEQTTDEEVMALLREARNAERG